MQLGNTFGFEQSCPTSKPNDSTPCAADSSVNMLDLLSGGANAMNGSNFVSFSFATGIPGVTVTNIRMATIEAAQSKLLRRFDGDFSDESQTVETSQVRFQIDLSVTVPGVNAPVTMPIVLDSARAVGRLTSTECREIDEGPPIDDPSEDSVLVQTSAVRARVATMSDAQLQSPSGASASAQLILPGVTFSGAIGAVLPPLFTVTSTITGTSDISAGGGSDTLDFFPNQPDDVGPPSQRSMGGIGAANAGTSVTQSLTTTLPGLANAAFVNSLNNVLNGPLNNLDKNLFQPLLYAAGVSLGGADVRSYNMECNVPQLVQ
jgi:hypothetical protein